MRGLATILIRVMSLYFFGWALSHSSMGLGMWIAERDPTIDTGEPGDNASWFSAISLNTAVLLFLAIALFAFARPLARLVAPSDEGLSLHMNERQFIRAGTFLVGLYVAVIGVTRLAPHLGELIEQISVVAQHHDRRFDFYRFEDVPQAFIRIFIGIGIMIWARR